VFGSELAEKERRERESAQKIRESAEREREATLRRGFNTRQS
jgi:hypothetical protein